MSVMEFVNARYMGTGIAAELSMGFGSNAMYDLDCNNGGDDCSIEDYCEG